MRRILILYLLVLPLINLYAGSYDLRQLSGWQLQGEIHYFQSDNLWEHINGAADQFIDYDFRVLQTAELVRDEMEISVEIYDMGSALNAYGIYSAERSAELSPLAIGSESVLALPGQALMYKDRFYVKVYIYEGTLTQQSGEELLNSIDQILPGIASRPSFMDVLPAQNKVIRSEKYIRTSYLGLSELAQCAFADYSGKQGDLFQRFVVLSTAEKSSEDILKNLPASWKKADKDGADIRYRKVPYRGFVAILKKGEILQGVAGVEDQDVMFKYLLGTPDRK